MMMITVVAITCCLQRVFVLCECVQAEVVKKGVQKKNLLSELQRELRKKDFTAGAHEADGISASFRLKSGRVNNIFPSTTSVKVKTAGWQIPSVVSCVVF